MLFCQCNRKNKLSHHTTTESSATPLSDNQDFHIGLCQYLLYHLTTGSHTAGHMIILI